MSRLVDGLGYAAAACVIATFCSRGLVPLRLFAIGSNILFIVYASAAGLAPILHLHLLLLPINVWQLRLLLALSDRGADAPVAAPEPPRPWSYTAGRSVHGADFPGPICGWIYAPTRLAALRSAYLLPALEGGSRRRRGDLDILAP